MKYLKIGSIVRRGSKMLRVEKAHDQECTGCAYAGVEDSCNLGKFERTMCSALQRKTKYDVIYREVHIKHLYGNASADESLAYWLQYKIDAITEDLAEVPGSAGSQVLEATLALLERYKELQKIFLMR